MHSEIGSGGFIGVFWRVEGTLVASTTQLAEAEPYGDFLTSEGHYEVWLAWVELTAAERRQNGLPEIIANTEYEEHPRGRVVFDMRSESFIVYADRRLQRRETISDVLKIFGLADRRYVVRSDSHYV